MRLWSFSKVSLSAPRLGCGFFITGSDFISVSALAARKLAAICAAPHGEGMLHSRGRRNSRLEANETERIQGARGAGSQGVAF